MDLQKQLSPYPVPVIVETVRCPPRTAYAWKEGTRRPPQWVQRLIMAALRTPAHKRAKS